LTDWRFHVQSRVTRATTRALRALGLRDAVVRWRLARARARREAAEARGQDHLSRPALHQLDMKLNAIIDRDGGFFVEAGANNGYTQSNTYWLERFRGWRGLLVEPMPELALEARLSRPGASVFQCALTEDDAQVLRMHFGDLMSVVDGARAPGWTDFGNVLGWRDPYELDVDGRTLSSLLDEIDAPEVDLLSLDVEGFEGPALRGLELERHAPRFILVEIHDRERDHPPVEAVLGGHYLAHSWLSPMDLLYVRRDEAQNGRRPGG
jgi:FkbM family methyltransferase